MLKIYRPTFSHPYTFSDGPIILRTACTAGVNRSATVREFVSMYINPDSKIFPQYGAEYGNYNNENIICVNVGAPDGFYDIFACDKSPSIQAILFSKLGYTLCENKDWQYLQPEHKILYKELILDYFWKLDLSIKNVFIIINENENVINAVIDQLQEQLTKVDNVTENIDLVILEIPDIIYYPRNGYESQSKEAYSDFLMLVKQLLKF